MKGCAHHLQQERAGRPGLLRRPVQVRQSEYKDPILVSSTDGVGTKILVAAKAEVYHSIGQDLVNHCVNDILVQGAKPLFFLDYFATGRLDPKVVADMVGGLAMACSDRRPC